MKKIVRFFIGILLCVRPGAYALVMTDAEQNMCYFVASPTDINAVFDRKQYTCDSGTFLPLNHDGCESCPTGHTCSGGDFAFDENFSQGISYVKPISANINYGCDKGLLFPQNHTTEIFAVFEPLTMTCNAGQYLPANAIACVQCPLNNACAGGTYSFNETVAQGITACVSGTFAPTGSSVCYPHILHVGNDNIYLKSTKQTTPSLNIRIGNDIFYANMTTVRTRMNKDSSHYFHVQWDNNDYYVCDDTTCPQ